MRKLGLHPKKDAFTLAELLVVIAIIGIMFAIALPAISNITGQTKLEAAANELHAAAKMARQHAITHSQPTYLVLNSGQTDDSMTFRAYAVFTINVHSRPVEQEDGQYITPWTVLPPGIIFDPDSTPDHNVFSPNEGDGWNGALSENGRLKIGNDNFAVIGFSPTGKTATRTNWTRMLILTEGSVQNNQAIRTSTTGKEIRFSKQGSSSIVDLIYNESGADPEDLTL